MREHCELFTHKLDSLDDYLDIIHVSPPNDKIFFRGQREADWLITSTFYRRYNNGVLPSLDEEFDYFVSKHETPSKGYIDTHASCVEHFMSATMLPQEFLDFHTGMTVAQHYGVPTNLIDFTFSSDIALFFAFNWAKYSVCSDYVAIYAIKPMGLLNQLVQCLIDHGIKIESAWNEVMTINRGDYAIKFPKSTMVGLALNRRVIQQQGTFIYWPSNAPLDLIIYRLETDGFLGTDHKFLIHKKYRDEAMSYLAAKGITEESLLYDKRIWRMIENEFHPKNRPPKSAWAKKSEALNHLLKKFDDPFLKNGNALVGMEEEEAIEFSNKFFGEIHDKKTVTIYDRLEPAAESACSHLDYLLIGNE